MREITSNMIEDFHINKLGYDFMGYKFKNPRELSFHHLIVAKQYCDSLGLGDGYYKWNGAILKRSTSHDYLHLIQRVDDDIFLAITSEMIDENIKGELSVQNLRRIRDLLLYFENRYKERENKKGRKLIKKEYILNRIDL